MAYKISERHLYAANKRFGDDDQKIHLGKLASVFLVFGLLSLLTALVFSSKSNLLVKSYTPSPTNPSFEIGPFQATRHNQAFSIQVDTQLPVQSWSFVEGQVLDGNKNDLFAFGEELWHEQGRDSDGYWREAEDQFTLDITLPKRGQYYLAFKTNSNNWPSSVKFRVYKKAGSSIPHLWFGIFLIIIGIVMNEMKNKTIYNTLQKFEQ